MVVTHAQSLSHQIVDGFNSDGDPKGPAVHYPAGDQFGTLSCTITAT